MIPTGEFVKMARVQRVIAHQEYFELNPLVYQGANGDF
jgi:hypothetical protein